MNSISMLLRDLALCLSALDGLLILPHAESRVEHKEVRVMNSHNSEQYSVIRTKMSKIVKVQNVCDYVWTCLARWGH